MKTFFFFIIGRLKLKKIICTTLFAIILPFFNSSVNAQIMRLYLAGTVFNSDLSLFPPNNGYVTNFEAINANYVKTFDNLFLASDIQGTSYTFAIRCRTNGAGGRIFSAKIQIGGEEVASASWTVSSSTMTLYTKTVTGIDPTITMSTEVKLILTIDGTSGATSGITLGDSSQSTPLYSYIEIPSTTSTGAKEQWQAVPNLTLKQNYPNPFNPVTNIKYQLQNCGNTRLIVYDMFGRKIRTLIDAIQSEGWHLAAWDGLDDTGRPVSTGTYIYQLENNRQRETKKMMIVK